MEPEAIGVSSVGVGHLVTLRHLPIDHRRRDHLGDLHRRFDDEGRVSQVVHHHPDLPPVAVIDHPSRDNHPLFRRHPRPVADKPPPPVGKLNGHAGFHDSGPPRRDRHRLAGEKVVAEIADARPMGETGVRVESFYFQYAHRVIITTSLPFETFDRLTLRRPDAIQ